MDAGDGGASRSSLASPGDLARGKMNWIRPWPLWAVEAALMPDAVEVRNLDAHDPLPMGQRRRVVVLRRFDEDDPRRIVTEITLSGSPGREEVVQPRREDGAAMSLDEAVAAARTVAESEGIGQVFVLDRTAGRLEHEVIEHRGDHSFPGKTLDDTDPEDGEAGPDMRPPAT